MDGLNFTDVVQATLDRDTKYHFSNGCQQGVLKTRLHNKICTSRNHIVSRNIYGI